MPQINVPTYFLASNWYYFPLFQINHRTTTYDSRKIIKGKFVTHWSPPMLQGAFECTFVTEVFQSNTRSKKRIIDTGNISGKHSIPSLRKLKIRPHVLLLLNYLLTNRNRFPIERINKK